MRVSFVFIFGFWFGGSGPALYPRPERAGPLLTKRTRLCPRRRAAEHQQLSDGGRKDVAAAGAMLRGATRGAGAGEMNTAEINVACLRENTWKSSSSHFMIGKRSYRKFQSGLCR